jgi:hypothetical protein
LTLTKSKPLKLSYNELYRKKPSNVPPTRSIHPPLANLFQVTRDAKVQINSLSRQKDNLYQIREMRTHTLHKQKPFRVKNTYLADPVRREIVDALQAVVDTFGDSDSLLALQCRSALLKAKQ